MLESIQYAAIVHNGLPKLLEAFPQLTIASPHLLLASSELLIEFSRNAVIDSKIVFDSPDIDENCF